MQARKRMGWMGDGHLGWSPQTATANTFRRDLVTGPLEQTIAIGTSLCLSITIYGHLLHRVQDDMT